MMPLNRIYEVFDLLPIPYIIIDYDTGEARVLSMNTAYKKLLQQPLPVSGHVDDHLLLNEPFFQKKFHKNLSACFHKKQELAFDYQTVNCNYEIRITPFSNNGSGTLLIASFYIHQVMHSQALPAPFLQYQFLDNMIEGCQVLDFGWNYLYINEAAAKQGRLLRDEYTSRNIFDIYPGVKDSALYEILNKCMTDRHIQKTEQEFTYNDGSTAWFDLHIYPSPDGIFILSLDITERKQSEQELLKSELKFKTLTEHSIDIISIIDEQFRFSYGSPSTEKYTGWTQQELRLADPKDFIHADDLHILSKSIAVALGSPGKAIPLDVRMLHRKGHYICIEGTITNLFHDESIKGLVLSVRDVTERRQSETALYESDEKFRRLFNSSPLPQWLFDSDTLKFIDVNDAAIRNYGYSRDEFLSMTIEDIRPVQDIARFRETRARLSPLQDFKDRSFIHKKKNGKLINVDLKSANVVINGKNARLVIARDITYELAFEQQLIESNERYNFVLEATNESIIDWDIVNDTTVWGKGFAENFGYDLTKYDNHLWSANIHREDRGQVLADLNAALENPSARNFDAGFRFMKANGEIAYVQHRGILIRNDKGVAVRAIGAMIDVTELHQKISEIETRNEKLKNIAWIQSHVVRAPLARLIGLVKLIENKDVDTSNRAELSEILSYIVASAHQLDGIIRDIVKKTETIHR